MSCVQIPPSCVREKKRQSRERRWKIPWLAHWVIQSRWNGGNDIIYTWSIDQLINMPMLRWVALLLFWFCWYLEVVEDGRCCGSFLHTLRIAWILGILGRSPIRWWVSPCRWSRVWGGGVRRSAYVTKHTVRSQRRWSRLVGQKSDLQIHTDAISMPPPSQNHRKNLLPTLAAESEATLASAVHAILVPLHLFETWSVR